MLFRSSTITGNTDNSEWINSKSTMATKIQAEINVKREILPLEEQVPKEFHEYLDVFSEEKAARFPEPWTWDHKIKMKGSFVPKSFKMYNLTPQEQIELDKFLKKKFGKRLHQTFSISHGIPILLCRRKRWKTSTLSGLPISQ